MNTPRFLKLQKEWRRRPPLAWLVASFLGHRAASEEGAAEAAQKTPASVAELQAAFPNGRL